MPAPQGDSGLTRGLSVLCAAAPLVNELWREAKESALGAWGQFRQPCPEEPPGRLAARQGCVWVWLIRVPQTAVPRPRLPGVGAGGRGVSEGRVTVRAQTLPHNSHPTLLTWSNRS